MSILSLLKLMEWDIQDIWNKKLAIKALSQDRLCTYFIKKIQISYGKKLKDTWDIAKFYYGY